MNSGLSILACERTYLLDASFYHSLNTIIQESDWDREKCVSSNNGFVQAVIKAYYGHHNFSIRPDDAWMAILVQFSSYVNANQGQFRSTFVKHEGKKELIVTQNATLETANYGVIAKQMTDQLQNNLVDSKLKEWIIPNFTTTTEDDVIAGSVVFMATMKNYFSYKCTLKCGIPETRIYGTLEDWIKVDKRIKELRKYGDICNKWVDMLEKIVSQFVSIIDGTPDLSFWSRICNNEGGGSGPSYISGWITAFCVFNDKGEWMGDRKEIKVWGKKNY